MIAQLTHLRPLPERFDEVVELLQEWGLSSSSAAPGDEMPFSFVSRDGGHLFVVSLHDSEANYRKSVGSSRRWIEKLMPLLVEHHGPTYYGEVLGMKGKGLQGSGIPVPPGIYIGDQI